MTGCYRLAINAFIEARKQKIDELTPTHGLGPGHNCAKSRTRPNAIPELVKRFKEEVLGNRFENCGITVRTRGRKSFPGLILAFFFQEPVRPVPAKVHGKPRPLAIPRRSRKNDRMFLGLP
jgi:hypothetical protein